MPQPQTPPPSQPPPPAPRPPDPASRRGGRALWIVLGVIVVLVLIGIVISALVSATRTTRTQAQSFSAGDLDTILVEGDAGDITIVAHDRDDVAVTTRLRSAVWERPDLETGISDRTLRISSDCRRIAFFSVCSADQEILLPRDTVDTLQLSTTAGDIEIEGFAGDVEVATTAGSIGLRGFRGETARIRTTAGEISVQADTAPTMLEATTTAGEVEITVPDEVYRVSTDTTVGRVDVDVRQDPGADRLISVRTTAGEITVSRG